jgi:F-type H+-transporting ATPase subunit delta
LEKLSSLYASALFNLAVESSSDSEFLEQAVLVHNTLSDAECRHVLVHPHIPAAEKRKLFTDAFDGKVRAELLGLLYLVIDKNREVYFLPALKVLIEMLERYRGKTTAKVISAAALSKKQTDTLKKQLGKKLDKQVDVSVKVDPSAIGGSYINADGYYIDRTVRKQLHELTVHMKKRCGV